MPVKNGKPIVIVATASGVVVVLLLALNWQALAAQYRVWRLFESLGVNAQGYPEYRHRQTGIIMVRVPGGRFLMGSLETDEDADHDEVPRHEVRLSPFLMAKYEVTEGQWKAAMGEYSVSYEYGKDDLPVSDASWEDCQSFCDATGLSPPTEAQWEYACRAGSTTRFSVGDSDSDLARVAWFARNSKNEDGLYERRVVGQKAPNAFGLHDMHGNVFEWCRDVYDRVFYTRAEASAPDPICTSGSSERVMRGGSVIDGPEWCTATCRRGAKPWSNDFVQGFRPSYHPLPW